MLKVKLNLKIIFCLLNIISFSMFYLKINVQLIDMMYLVFVLIFIIKCIYNKNS